MTTMIGRQAWKERTVNMMIVMILSVFSVSTAAQKPPKVVTTEFTRVKIGEKAIWKGGEGQEQRQEAEGGEEKVKGVKMGMKRMAGKAMMVLNDVQEQGKAWLRARTVIAHWGRMRQAAHTEVWVTVVSPEVDCTRYLRDWVLTNSVQTVDMAQRQNGRRVLTFQRSPRMRQGPHFRKRLRAVAVPKMDVRRLALKRNDEPSPNISTTPCA